MPWKHKILHSFYVGTLIPEWFRSPEDYNMKEKKCASEWKLKWLKEGEHCVQHSGNRAVLVWCNKMQQEGWQWSAQSRPDWHCSTPSLLFSGYQVQYPQGLTGDGMKMTTTLICWHG